MSAIRLAWLVLALGSPAVARAAEVVVYRCTDARGHLTLRDTPCRPGERQEARSMLRPVDPPPSHRAAATPAAPAPVAPPGRTRVVVVTPPRPLYECVTPDGDRYTSESDAGNPRWLPFWTVGGIYPPWPAPGHPRPPRVEGRVQGEADGGRVRYELRTGEGHRRPRPPVAAVAPYVAGTWVRDACSPLPPREVCARLRDRRFELDRQYNSALQSERARITAEQRGIDARLANDCGEG